MNTSFTDPRQKPTKRTILDSFSEMRNQPDLSISRLKRWVEQNLNTANKIVTGNTGREVYGLSYACDVREQEGKPIATIALAGSYDFLQRQPIKLHRLESFLPDITIVAPDTAANIFRADLLLDLTKWQVLVPECLNASLYWGYVATTFEPGEKQQYKNEVEVIQKHFYPQLPIELFSVAAALGYVNIEPDTFKGWLKQHATSTITMPVDLPMNIY